MEQRLAEMAQKSIAEARTYELHSEHGSNREGAITEVRLKEDRQMGRDRKVESLGTRNFDGVQAVGTRMTFTFAAGREGNDQPFDVVTERWYSPELQTVVMTRHSDPRSGENIYRLANISRSEPARSLFEPPSDFKLKEETVELRKKEAPAGSR